MIEKIKQALLTLTMFKTRCRSIVLRCIGWIVILSTFVSCNPPSNLESKADKNGNAAIEGNWEGEFQASKSFTYITVKLKNTDSAWNGSIKVLGQEHSFEEVKVTQDSLKAILVPGPDGISLEANLDKDQLLGYVIEGDARYPLELNQIPDYPEPANRDEAWKQDLNVLAERFLHFDRSFSPAESKQFVEQINDVHDRVSELEDSEIIMQMASAVALSGNAHTRLYLLRNRTELRRLPIRLWWFEDRLYVVSSKENQKDLLGCRVDEIGGKSVRYVRDRVGTAFAGNPSWTDYKSVYYMTSPEVLKGLGITAGPDHIDMSFSKCKTSNFSRTLEPLPLVRSQEPVEAWRDLTPRHHQEGWSQVLEKSDKKLPLYLQNPDRFYWFDYDKQNKLLYFQYNRSSEIDRESIASFGDRLLKEFKDQNVDTFVLDLRFNTGGNLTLASDLMKKLQQQTKDITSYIITGRATFSAGITHVASWMENGDIKLVGEPVGDELDFWAEGGNIILPNSDLAAHFANAYHSYSEKPCPKGIPCFLDLSSPEPEPETPLTLSWEEYISGVDPALDFIKSAAK